MTNERIKIYDNGGKTYDRYTAVFMDRPERQAGTFEALGFNENPFEPLGFGQHTSAMPGRHLGKLIKLDSLPAKARSFVEQNLTPDEPDDLEASYYQLLHYSDYWNTYGNPGPSDTDELFESYSEALAAYEALEVRKGFTCRLWALHSMEENGHEDKMLAEKKGA